LENLDIIIHNEKLKDTDANQNCFSIKIGVIFMQVFMTPERSMCLPCPPFTPFGNTGMEFNRY